MLYANGRYYDPATGRYLTPGGQFDPLRPSTHNPYAPAQGPWWLLLPLMGIVVAWKGRRGGVGRMLLLVLVVGVGMSIVGCGESPQPESEDGIPQPPSQPESPQQPDQTDPNQNVQFANHSDLIATSVKIFLPPPIFQCPPDDADIDIPNLPGQSGLGTIIHYGDTVAILTHDHFDKEPKESEKIILTRGLGVVSFSGFDYDPIDPQNTSLMILPKESEQKLQTELLGKPAELSSIKPTRGDYVQIVHLPGEDFIKGQPAVLATRFNDVNPDNGRLILEDKEETIKPGDSGGGVFYNGKLIANTAAINRRFDTFNPDEEIWIVEAPLIPLSLQ